jgi:hypothetical protein
MKRLCPICAQAYDEHVSFCFVDGTPLAAIEMEPTPPPVPRRSPSVAPQVDEERVAAAPPAPAPPAPAPTPPAAPLAPSWMLVGAAVSGGALALWLLWWGSR